MMLAVQPLSPIRTSQTRRFFQLHVQTQAADFVGQHVEAGRRAGFERVLALDHRLVNLRAAFHVVALDGQQLLQDVGGAVGLQRPDFHFAEPLAAEAGLAAQRLLRDQRVRAGRAGVDLVVDQVVQLQHVDVADRRSAARTARRCGRRTAAPCRARAGRPRSSAFVDVFLGGPVEDRRDGLEAQLGAGPAQVRFENLAHVHTAGHAQRIEQDVHRRAVGQERHVFLRAGSWRSRPCCRAGRPSCRRPRSRRLAAT